MKFYIAGHNQDDARKVAKLCAAAGHTINSTWLQENFGATADYTEADRERIAQKDVREVQEADAVVFLPSATRVPGGKFVEAGVALGLGKRVFILGHRENMLMWHPLTECFNSAEEFLKKWRALPPEE